MPGIVNSIKRFIAGLAILTVVASVTVILYSLYIAAPITEHNFATETIGIVMIVAFAATILLFIRRSRPLMARYLGDQATTIVQLFMGSIAVLIMAFAVLNTIGVSPQALLTGAGFASITIGLIISTFVGGLLAGALVFATHKLRVGDSVIVNNIPGTVIELTALVTRVRTDMGVTTIPNSAISSGSVIITKLQKYEPTPERRLPYQLGDRVATTYMPGEGIVKEITSLRTTISLDSGRQVTFLNSSILSGAIAVAKITESQETTTD